MASDVGSQHMSSTGDSSGVGVPASTSDSPTVTMLTSLRTFPTINEGKPVTSSVAQAPTPPRTVGSEQADEASTENENDTLHPTRFHQGHLRTSAQALAFDPDATPRATARKQTRWSIGVHPASLPMPDFGVAGTKVDQMASHPADIDIKRDAVPDFPTNDTLRAAPLTYHPSDNKQPAHQKRPERRFKKRFSIAPFPNVTPQTLSIHDTPVTARTRGHGEGKSRRFSLMLGGTIRGQPQDVPTLPSDKENPRGDAEMVVTPRRADEGTNGAGSWTIERAAQAAPSDVEMPPSSRRSYSLQHGVAISKLAELLGRDR